MCRDPYKAKQQVTKPRPSIASRLIRRTVIGSHTSTSNARGHQNWEAPLSTSECGYLGEPSTWNIAAVVEIWLAGWVNGSHMVVLTADLTLINEMTCEADLGG
ncbi:hypothetical protein HRR83_001962 [Exophiala dermatitidis]|uniref:Uncharacterized protein n=1 Tax=Exophiala dermatitidis TaxID=5970 RepID=A0AAN6IZR1_EXODE|nr:hypothetical protein HRR73_005417 [Exophiala dermatitidis]KAJ4523845.1 hypothetical protein HRR74_002039 [Exophiala dermatitidis]KAJ4537217.1 hypothetical protein HRR76_005230 [Exophiala dermatitidis]KAJ4555185.1 hypothetical protein HRR77_001126 [Exophiala dermatitidis]KAJ4566367.1 hypothetical protein HRR79_005376 [Exophiala dermatitidis]